MKDHSVVFIGPVDCHGGKVGLTGLIKELPVRVMSSFLPPLIGGPRSRAVYVDFLGPSIALTTLLLLLHHGHSNKNVPSNLSLSPAVCLLYYAFTMPVLSYVVGRIGGATLSLLQVASLLGYALYGHIIPIIASLIFDSASSSLGFYISMALFGGLSGLRLTLVLLLTIPKPAARLLVCSLVTTLHFIFLLFVHFSYVHPTFVYGRDF